MRISECTVHGKKTSHWPKMKRIKNIHDCNWYIDFLNWRRCDHLSLCTSTKKIAHTKRELYNWYPRYSVYSRRQHINMTHKCQEERGQQIHARTILTLQLFFVTIIIYHLYTQFGTLTHRDYLKYQRLLVYYSCRVELLSYFWTRGFPHSISGNFVFVKR